MTITESTVVAWLRQPTSIAGLAGIAGTLTGVASHALTWELAAPLLVGGAIALLIPESPKARADGEHLAVDALAAVASRSPAAIAVAVGDAVQVAADLAPAVTTVTVNAPVDAAPAEVAAVADAAVSVLAAAKAAVPALMLVVGLGLAGCTAAQDAAVSADAAAAVADARAACVLNGVAVSVDPKLVGREGATTAEVCAVVGALPAAQ